MRAKYSFIAVSTLLFSLNAYAGLFDSTPDFKCGRDDAISAVQSKIRDDAVSKLQVAYLANPSDFYGKPLKDYIAKANEIAIVMANVTTKSSDDEAQARSCSATVTLTVPSEIMGYIASYPDRLRRIINDGGKVLNNSVQWDKFTYSLSMADNGKDISVSYEYNNKDYISESIAAMATLAMNKDELQKAELNNKLNIAARNYSDSDRQLNELWKYLPDSVKASMKKEQNMWINEKAKKCGKISDASSATTPLPTRIGIYDCQTKMTDERFRYLGGDEEHGY